MLLCRYFTKKNICQHLPILFTSNLGLCLYRQFSKDVGDVSATESMLDCYCDSFFIPNSPKLQDKTSFRVKLPVGVKSDHLLKLFHNLSDDELLFEIDQMAKEMRLEEASDLLCMCAEKQINLPVNFLFYIVKLFARLGETRGLEIAIKELKNLDVNLYSRENGFIHYTAQSSWMQGKFVHSTQIFKEMIKLNKCFNSSEKLVLQTIISDSISNRGEAALFIMKEFVEDISKIYGEYFPMVIFWKNLFESEWFVDQQLSKELLKDNQKLLDYIHWIIPMWSYRLLKIHKTDVVLRLCEVLLQYNHLDCYTSVLHNLFDYHYSRGNVKKCTTIMKNALDLNITMRESQQKRFLILLTTGKPGSISESTQPTSSKMKIDLHF